MNVCDIILSNDELTFHKQTTMQNQATAATCGADGKKSIIKKPEKAHLKSDIPLRYFLIPPDLPMMTTPPKNNKVKFKEREKGQL